MLWSRWDIIKSSDVPVGTDSKIAIELPNDLFWGYVPVMATFNEKYLQDFGVLAVSNRDLDDEENEYVGVYGNDRTFVKWTISDMVNGYINGYSFSFYRKEDLITVHNHIEAYFDRVNEIINSESMDAFEFDDRLEDIDAFNRSLFEQNKGKIVESRQALINKVRLGTLYPELIIQQNIPRNMSEVSEYNRKTEATTSDGILIPGKWLPPVTPKEKPILPDNPLAPIFAQEPMLNLKPNYVSRYVSPEERKLEAEYENAKRILKEREKAK